MSRPDPKARRVFLGRQGPLLQRAADWLLEQLGPELAEHVVVLPGRRAARRLLDLLVGRLPEGRPPTLLTSGVLVDHLVGPRGELAGHFARTLNWSAALAGLPAEQVACLDPRPPEPDDLPGWRELGSLARRLHGQLAAADLGFADVVEPAGRLAGPAEARRWAALAAARDRYLSILAEQGQGDPHETRRRAVAEGRLARGARVVLVGVVEADGLLRSALCKLESAPVSLVFAPESECDDFDALGCIDVSAWSGREVSLDRARWFVEQQPADQARRVVALLADPVRRRAASEITVGLLDPQVGPPLESALGRVGVAARDPAGTPLQRSAPARLLAATAAWLASRGMSEFAALLRHPDVDALLQAHDAPCLVSDLDAYRAAHLPLGMPGRWLATDRDVALSELKGPRRRQAREERDRRDRLARAERRWWELLGDLSLGGPRPPSDWVAPLRAWLARIYGERALDRDHDRALVETLGALGDLLGQLASGTGWERPVSAGTLLAELYAALAGKTLVPPPAPDAIELLGWLELPLDDAPLLVLTGVNDGRLPEPVSAEPALPEKLAGELGLPDDAQRLARDAMLLTTLIGSRPEVLLITGRRSAENDPLRPSRLLFAADDETVARAVATVVRGGGGVPQRRASEQGGAPARALPMAADHPPVLRMSVTSFKVYMDSPYRFYLERVLRLSGMDDGGDELDPLAFGTLAHAALEAFGRSEERHATRADVIEKLLRGELERAARDRYGSRPLPAVALQLSRLGERLARFAHWQAGWAGEGWRVRHVEWTPAQPVTLELDGEPMELKGSIDRIDRNETSGEWAILDYKTSEKGKSPVQTHRRAGAWVDLQLPLYRELARELKLPDDVLLGYVNLPADPDQVGVKLVPREGKGAWDAELLAEALETARDVIRAVRAGRFDELGSLTGWGADEPLLSALGGLDLLDAPEPELRPEGDGEEDGA